MRKKHRCEGVDTANFGYGEVEVHDCGDAAEFTMKEYDVDFDRFGVTEVITKVRLCLRHAVRMREHGLKVYRYRRIAS